MNRLSSHEPVLLTEVLRLMAPEPGKNYIDATCGPGNMSRALLERSGPDGRVLSLDFDPRAFEEQEKLLGEFGDRIARRRANFSDVKKIAEEEGFVPADGILYDLGMSSRMVDSPDYGAAIRHDSHLDMRMDPDLETTAYDLVNTLPERDLVELLRGMDERRFARRIARAIVRAREREPIETTGQLASLIADAVPKRFHPKGIHVATRPFLALRVAVNSERESLTTSLRDCPEVLAPDGVLVVICYASFEDRILKAEIQTSTERWSRLTRKAIRPGVEEIARNPRSRSARLRAYRKIA